MTDSAQENLHALINVGSTDRITSPERSAALQELGELVRRAGITVDMREATYQPGVRGVGGWDEVAIFIGSFLAGKGLDELYDLTRHWARAAFSTKEDKSRGERVVVVTPPVTWILFIDSRGEVEETLDAEDDE